MDGLRALSKKVARGAPPPSKKRKVKKMVVEDEPQLSQSDPSVRPTKKMHVNKASSPLVPPRSHVHARSEFVVENVQLSEDNPDAGLNVPTDDLRRIFPSPPSFGNAYDDGERLGDHSDNVDLMDCFDIPGASGKSLASSPSANATGLIAKMVSSISVHQKLLIDLRREVALLGVGAPEVEELRSRVASLEGVELSLRERTKLAEEALAQERLAHLQALAEIKKESDVVDEKLTVASKELVIVRAELVSSKEQLKVISKEKDDVTKEFGEWKEALGPQLVREFNNGFRSGEDIVRDAIDAIHEDFSWDPVDDKVDQLKSVFVYKADEEDKDPEVDSANA